MELGVLEVRVEMGGLGVLVAWVVLAARAELEELEELEELAVLVARAVLVSLAAQGEQPPLSTRRPRS